ncbi:ABC transporter ATP-binding protein [Lachnospiraceae bacterium 42-17]|jgi:ABC-2 type transport system ATP-binding protein|nr:ABC transporter ATP-binding protein [Dorea sp.]
MSTTIKIRNLNQYYGKKQALKNVNLTIETGMFGLLGRNGAGKTTLMKVLATLLPKSEGEVTVCGTNVSRAQEVRKNTGYLPQEFSMYPNMTVYEAMDYLGVLSGLSKSERKQRIPKLLERVNLLENRRKKVKALSGGMKRRLGIAQAILHDPKVLIVDEPTAGLDPEERVRFRNLLCEIAEDRIVILSTHIVGDIEATCENIAVLDEGEIIYKGTVSELTGMAEGKVFQAEISKRELETLKKQCVVTSMLTLGNNVMVRFLSDEKPFASAKPCEAGVEDAYMYLMQERGGGDGCLDNYL